MKAVHGRCAFMACLMSIFVGILSGCTVGGKSFAIDSNSRVPFFGLELQERKPKKDGPLYRSIARTKSDLPDVKVALQTVPTTGHGPLKKRDRRLATTSFSRVLEPEAERTPAIKRGANDQRADSFPLPRTDEHQSAVDRQPARPAVDFQ